MVSKKSMLKVLDKSDIEAIHGATMTVLASTGVFVNSAETLGLLKEKGLDIDERSKVVKMSESVVMDAVRSCKRNFKLCARNKKHDLIAVDGRTKNGPGAQCIYYLDPETEKIRSPTLADGIMVCRLLDALPNIHVAYIPTHISDVPEQYSSLVTMAGGLLNSSKCAYGSSSDAADVELTMKIADALLGDRERLRKRPMFAGYIDPISPLGHEHTMLEVLLGYLRMDQPVFVTVMALAGGTAPASLAGLLVQQNAEVLSSIVIGSCVTKTPRIIYGSVSCPLDMRYGTAATGSPEFSLIGVGAIQLAKYYKLPSNMGVQGSSNAADAQASYEKTFSALAASAAGADFSDLFYGSLNAFDIFSPIQAVIDDEIAANAARLASGIEVSDETLSVDVISKVGPMGNYLKNMNTLKRFRAEHATPTLSNRLSIERWTEMGAKDTKKRAKERMVELLSSHTPEPLETEARKNIDSLLREYTKSIGADALEKRS